MPAQNGGQPLSIAWTRLPFRFEDEADYTRRLQAWIGEAFYERLPAAGYQVREEQIYFAYRVAAALHSGRPILAEAGSGTGKTFAYLLPAICHARLHGRPVVVATATPALQQQLAGPDGDAAALSRLLDLEVDARVALAPEDVVCDLRVEGAGRGLAGGRRIAGRTALLRWAASSATGVRSEHPGASDDLWRLVAWNGDCRCDTCPRRGYCRLTRAREHGRGAADLVVCSHDLVLQDTLGRDRLPPGRLPVLPPFSGVVFDEGHRVAIAAQRAAGSSLAVGAVLEAVRGVAAQGVRLRLIRCIETAEEAVQAFAAALAAASEPDSGGPRRGVRPEAALAAAARVLRTALDRLQDEMAVEEGLHEETAYAQRLSTYATRMDAAQAALTGLGDPARVAWLEKQEGAAEEVLWVVPRDLGPIWRRAMPPRTPLAFSSATLAGPDGSFAYAAASLGLRDALGARVGVPFRLARQVVCYLPRDAVAADGADFWSRVAPRVAEVLAATGGRALVLVPDAGALRELRACLDGPGRLLWEGDAAPEALLREFASDVGSSLVASNFWEGIDVPGATLSAVVIPRLPLPGPDPVVEARRQAAAAAGQDPAAAVDIPDMTLRLKQGVGRLIRLESDRGVVAVLDARASGGALGAAVEAALPAGARRVRTLGPVRRFLEAGAEAPVRAAERGAGRGSG